MNTNNSVILKVKNISKDYGNQKGVFDLSFSLKSGEVIGFIGPNGAGKTTTISVLVGLLFKDKGSLKIFDKENVNPNNISSLMPKIGVMLGERVFEEHLSGMQILRRNQSLYPKNLQPTITKNILDLTQKLNIDLAQKFNKLSLGNQKKIGIINCLMHNPDLIILDEPTSGLDPLIKKIFLKELSAAKNKGAGIILSSHILTEVEEIADTILMIKHGRKILQDSKNNIQAKALKEFWLHNPDPEIIAEIKKSKLDEITKIQQKGQTTIILASKRERVLKILINHNFFDFYLKQPSLEDMFMESYDDKI